MRLEECLDVIDCVIIFIEDICVMCRSVDKVIRSRVLNIPLGFLHL